MRDEVSFCAKTTCEYRAKTNVELKLNNFQAKQDANLLQATKKNSTEVMKP